MEFLKRVVPPAFSGDLVLDAGDKAQGTSPRLLKMRRLYSTASERTVGDPGGSKSRGSQDDSCQHQHIGNVNAHRFQFFQDLVQGSNYFPSET